LEQCSAILLKYYTNLDQSEITIKDLKILKGFKERLVELLEIVQPGEEENLKKLFDTRLKELADYQELYTVMLYLSDFLKNISEKTGINFLLIY